MPSADIHRARAARMKPAPFRHIQETGHDPGDLLELSVAGLELSTDPGDGSQEALGIGMEGFLEEPFDE